MIRVIFEAVRQSKLLQARQDDLLIAGQIGRERCAKIAQPAQMLRRNAVRVRRYFAVEHENV